MIFIDNFESIKDYPIVSGTPASFSNNEYSVANNTRSCLGQVIPDQQTVCQTFDLEVNGLVGTGTENAIAVLRDGSTDQLVLLLNNTGTLEVKRGNTSLGTSSFVFQNLVKYTVSFKATIDDANGSFEVRVENTPVLVGANVDTKNGSTTLVNLVILGLANTSNFWGGAWIMKFSNYHISQDFIPPGSVVLSSYPTGNGVINDFEASSGENWEAVLTDDGDASYVFGVGTELYVFEDLPANVISINAVQIDLVARKEGSGPTNITPVIGPSHDGQTILVFSGYTTNHQVFDLDPSNELPWTVEGFNNTEFGFRS